MCVLDEGESVYVLNMVLRKHTQGSADLTTLNKHQLMVNCNLETHLGGNIKHDTSCSVNSR